MRQVRARRDIEPRRRLARPAGEIDAGGLDGGGGDQRLAAGDPLADEEARPLGAVIGRTHQKRVVDAQTCKFTLAVMTIAGLYERSGDWLYDVGLPGKSGISGGIVTVSPGKGGFGAFAPRLDNSGNSVKGQLAARYLSERLGLSLFASQAEP